MNKVIDLFHYSGETEHLIHKIEKTSSIVDQYWISNFSDEENLLSVLSEVGITKEIEVKIFNKVDFFSHDKNLVNDLIENKISFESILIFSNVDEIYELNNMENYLPFGFHILELDETNFDSNLPSNNVLGPIVCYRTNYCYEGLKFNHIVQQKKGTKHLQKKYVIKNSGYKITPKIQSPKTYFVLE
jgi:hypothetical protein